MNAYLILRENARTIVNGMSSQPQLYADNAQAYVETMGNSVA